MNQKRSAHCQVPYHYVQLLKDVIVASEAQANKTDLAIENFFNVI